MAIDHKMLLILKSSSIGESEPDLGEKLMKAFLTAAADSGQLPARLICMNTAVFLTTEGSPVLELMQQLEAAGGEIRSCGTCLDYFGRTEKLRVSKPTNMRDTMSALQSFSKVLQP